LQYTIKVFTQSYRIRYNKYIENSKGGGKLWNYLI